MMVLLREIDWPHGLAEILLGVAYVIIACLFFFLARRLRDFPFPRLLPLAAVFSALLALGHLASLVLRYLSLEPHAGTTRIVAGIAACIVALALLRITPKALALPSIRDLGQRLAAEAAGRRKAEESLRRSEELARQQLAELQLVYDSAPTGLAVLDRDLRYVRVNRRLAEINGISVEEQLGRSIEDLLPDLEPPIGATVRRVLETGEPVNELEVRGRRPGRPDEGIWRVSYRPLDDSAGTRKGIVAVVEEITERKRADEALRQSEARKAAILQSALDSIIGMDHTGRIVEFNASAETTFGIPREQAVGRYLADLLIPPELRERHWAGLKHYLETGESSVIGRAVELEALRADGTRFPVELTVTRIQIEGPPLFLGYVRDITERRRAVQALRDREARLRAIVETAVDGILTIDEKGIVDTVNPAAERLFGYRAEEVIGRNVSMLMPAPYQGEHNQYVERYLDTGEKKIIGIGREVMGLRKDGSTFHMHLSVSEMAIGGRRMFTGIARDITELKLYEAQLEQRAEELARSNAELKQFAYVASHDLREPLRMVSNYAELLARRYRGRLDADADEFIGFTVDGVSRMQSLLDALLDYSRVGTRGLELTEVDAAACVREALANLALAIEENGAEIQFDGLPRIVADARQLVQLFQNLVGNAIKFHGEEPPRVEVRAKRRAGEWLFAVEDNGIGIEQEHAERVFVVFQRLHSRQRYPGTGIGLSICKKIVERHGGRIWFESRPPKGTTFFFTLPDLRRARA